ncbi:Polar-differentiation response regulator DivK [compost metagenome]
MEAENNVSLVLMDMMMPEIDGYEAIRLIRSSAVIKDLPIIAVTAQAMSGDREKCLEAGAQAYVSKPIDVDVLLTEVERLI